MPEMSKVIIPPHMGDKQPNEKILKLGKKITDVAKHKLFGVTVDDPEYWGLAEIVTDEMADVALKMKVRTPYTLDEMVALTGWDSAKKDDLNKLLEEMAYVGLLEYDYGYHYDHNGRTAPQSERRYILPMFVPGSAELFNMHEDAKYDCKNVRLEEHPAVATFFERMTFVPLAGITQMVPEGGAGIGMHVIPVEKAIEMESTSVDLEHLSYWLKKYEGHIGVGICSCRASRAKMEEGCGDDYYAWCIGVGDFADYCRETGKGHDITYDEAIAILKKGEEMGYVHQITNIDGENKIFGICNCNINICNALRTSQLFNTPNMSASAYRAEVNTENCVACAACVEDCPAGALKLGQKLCKKDGSFVKYAKAQLPDNHKWGKDKWDENYRETRRKTTWESGTSPCKTACPAHISVQGYLQKAKEGDYKTALEIIRRNNPFPAVCGRVCNKKCEDACTRGTIDRAVAIDDVKRFLAEQELNPATRPVVKNGSKIPASPARFKVKDHFDEKIAIIGAGPAGLSAAYYLGLMGYRPTVFEANEKPGGMMRYGIPSYKLQKDVIDAEIEIIKEAGAEIKCGVRVGEDITIEELRKQGYKAFYIAIGCHKGRRPGLANDDAEGTFTAIDYLKEANCGGKEFAGDVVVIGGGNVSIDAARVSKRNGAKTVTMFSLEDREHMPASKIEVKETLEDGVVINNSWGPKEILVENGKVTGIVLKKCLSTIDETGKFNPKYDENETTTIKCDRLIFGVGQTIDWGNLLKGEDVELMRNTYPVADKMTYQTAVKDIFVGGDVYTGPKFVINAIAAGKEAADSLHRAVQPGCSMTIGKTTRSYFELDKDDIRIDDYDHAGRQEPAGKYDMSFNAQGGVFTEEQVKQETSRCLKCGACIVDQNKCIGCGICTTRCKFDAIHLIRSHPNATTMVKSEDKFKKILPYQAKRAVKILFSKDKD